MGTTCSCVGPCEKPSCFSNLKYKLQYTAENRRQNRQCPCTNRRPKCLRRRRKRRNTLCDCEEIDMPPQSSHVFQDCECPFHPEPTVKTPPSQQKTVLRCRSRSLSLAPQINLFPCTAQKPPNLLPAASGYQARPSTPATKDAYTYTNIEETPPSEPPTPQQNKCPRSKLPTPVCPRKTVCTWTNIDESPPSEPASPRPIYRSKPSSPGYPKKLYISTAETETPSYEHPTFMQKTCLRSKQHTSVCPKRMMTKSASIQVQRPDRPTMRARSPGESRSPSPTCNKETCPFLTGYLSRSPSPEHTKKICTNTNNNVQIDDVSNNSLTENNVRNICRFVVDAYFV